MQKCPDCEGESFDPEVGNGKCAACYGTGLEQNVLDAFAKSLGGESQVCEVCDGSKRCQTCYGKGYLSDF